MTTTHSPTYMYLAARASKMGDMGVEKRREMSMAVSNSPTCTNNATTSPALTNGPTGVEDNGKSTQTCMCTRTHPGKNPGPPVVICLCYSNLHYWP